MSKRQITSNRLNYNAGIMSWYVKELKKLVKAMTDESFKELAGIYKDLGSQIELEISAPFKGEDARRAEGGTTALDDSISSQIRIALNKLQRKYGGKFDERSKELVKQLLKKTNRYSNMQINNALKDMLGDKAKGFGLLGSAISPEKSEVMKALIFENVSLIRSISDEYFKQITGSVARSIEGGSSLKQLAKELKEYGAKTQRRADLIAQDQTRKAYTSINLRNFADCNIQKVKWLHSGGSREPREYHMKSWLDGGLNGLIFDIDNPPVIDLRTGERGYPGTAPYCRCVMQAVLDFED